MYIWKATKLFFNMRLPLKVATNRRSQQRLVKLKCNLTIFLILRVTKSNSQGIVYYLVVAGGMMKARLSFTRLRSAT